MRHDEPRASGAANTRKNVPVHLMNRNFFLLWQGQFVSQIGSQAFLIGVAFWTKQATGSASLIGLIMMLVMLPGVVLGLLGGTLADRYSRKKIIVLSDVINGVTTLVLAALFFRHADSTYLLTACLLIVAVMYGVIQAFFGPAILASIPDLVPAERVAAANSMSQFSRQFSIVAGQGSGGILFAVLGVPLLFLIDGLTFLFSALSESFIHIPQHPLSKNAHWRDDLEEIWRDLISGLRFVWERTGMRDFLVMVGLVNCFAMPLLVLLPFYVDLNLGKGAEWFGFLMAGFSAGSVVGYIGAGTLRVAGKARSRLLMVLLVGAALNIVILGFVHEPALALLIEVVSGVLLGMFNVNVMTILQTTVSSQLRGRVMGLVLTITTAASPLGMLAGGIAGDLTGHNIPLIFAVCGGLVVIVVLLLGARRPVMDYLAS